MALPCGAMDCLRFMIVIFPDHTYLLFVSNETQIALLFFQGRISAIQEIRADLFLTISLGLECVC